MKKIKLMGLLSAPIVLSTMPIFSTSCSSSATITLTGTTQVDNRADLENFQKDIYDKFLKDKYTYFGSPVENHSSDSIYNQSLVNDFKSEINSPTILRQAAL